MKYKYLRKRDRSPAEKTKNTKTVSGSGTDPSRMGRILGSEEEPLLVRGEARLRGDPPLQLQEGRASLDAHGAEGAAEPADPDLQRAQRLRPEGGRRLRRRRRAARGRGCRGRGLRRSRTRGLRGFRRPLRAARGGEKPHQRRPARAEAEDGPPGAIRGRWRGLRQEQRRNAAGQLGPERRQPAGDRTRRTAVQEQAGPISYYITQ